MPRSHSQFVEEPGFDLRQSSSDTDQPLCNMAHPPIPQTPRAPTPPTGVPPLTQHTHFHKFTPTPVIEYHL